MSEFFKHEKIHLREKFNILKFGYQAGIYDLYIVLGVVVIILLGGVGFAWIAEMF